MTKKFIITIMVTMMTLTAAFAETHWVSSGDGFNWTDKYVTNNEDAKALICEYLGLSGAEFEQFKGKYTIDMTDPATWDGYNKLSFQYKTPNASFIKCVGKDTYAVFSFSNGQHRYGNVFTKAKK